MESVEDGNEKRKLQRERKKRREERDRKKKEMGTERARIRRRGRGEEICTEKGADIMCYQITMRTCTVAIYKSPRFKMASPESGAAD